MFCTFAYVSGGDSAFEQSVPLIAHGEFLKARGLSNDLHVFFMAGAERLSQTYRARLEALGFRLHDADREMKRVLARFPDILRLSDYAAFGYLRWVLARELLEAGQIQLPFIAVDGDVLITANFFDIARDVAGKTFMLQGCPCFTAISDAEWLTVYERELGNFSKNCERYYASARAMLRRPERDDREFCNSRLYAIPFRHDQDLQECLIAAGTLPQARSREIFDGSAFYWVQNPLSMGEWKTEQGVAGARPKVVDQDGSQFVTGKRIPFIHFQNDFAWYAHCWLRFSDLGLGAFAPMLRERTRTGELPWKVRIAGGLLRRLDPRTIPYSRASVYERALARNPATGNMFLTDIMNTCW